MCASAGDNNSEMIKIGESQWMTLTQLSNATIKGSWMIKAITSSTSTDFHSPADNITSEQDDKIMHNGKLVILHNGKRYDSLGNEL